MPESPLSASPYDVLGVAVTASESELRRAYRHALRRTHPDTGGSAARFAAVQDAWERIGTAERRAAWDAGSGIHSPRHDTFTASSSRPNRHSRPKARSHGHPGGWRRERFLAQMREWVGRGVELDDPYDPALVRSAPREIRHTLADALAEESTARTLSDLGIGYSVWHDVSTGDPEAKVDHVVLGPTGLFALLSEDFGGEVRARKGDLIGDVLDNARPIHDLAHRARVLSRQWRVRFTGLIIVLPDDALPETMMMLGSSRGSLTAVVTQSGLSGLLRAGLPGSDPIGGNELFDVRSRVGDAVVFV